MTPANKPPAKIETFEDEEGLNVEALEPLFRPDKRELGVQMVTTMVQRVHSGPLPAPDTYGHYEQVLPGSAERILAMAEKEQDHRHRSEGRVIFHEYGIRYVSQGGAILALMMLCSLVAYCAYEKQPLPAAVIGAVGAIVVAFLRYTQMKAEADTPAPPPPPKKQQPKRKR